MPELPEVETMRRGILPIVGARIVCAERTPCKRRPISVTPRIDHLNKRLSGQRVAAVDRIGKRVVIRTENDERLIMEPRMTGLVLIEAPPTVEHARFRLRLKGVGIPEVLFWDRRGLGLVYLLTDAEYQSRFLTGKLGPDALEITTKEFRERLKKSQRPIKVALLDQGVLAGVGNLYASEILHLSKIDPRRKCSTLTVTEFNRIHRDMLTILNQAIQYEGSTLSDGTYRNAINGEGSYQNQHRVYDRAETPCPACHKGPVIRIVQAQRATFFCERCQK